ncbi:hypothetical protein WA026_014021 [Henosepilachna vigintioctopunctata]|uniref:Uncharacterized protein n=1 Tax=Henosepilachna vigintioctopunctata TaxID=420089 RepID=A0AAW1U6K8_9CUCU
MNGTKLQYNMETGNESRLYSNNIFNNDQDSETSLNASVNSEPLKTVQYSDDSRFRFNFNIKYNTMVEESLYPKLYQKFNIDGYPVLQHTGYHRTVCLACQCDLWMQKNFQSVFSHASGHKHQSKVTNPAVIKNLKSYHEVFLNFQPCFQAHQVFFVPDNDPSCVKCILCMLFVKKHDVSLIF